MPLPGCAAPPPTTTRDHLKQPPNPSLILPEGGRGQIEDRSDLPGSRGTRSSTTRVAGQVQNLMYGKPYITKVFVFLGRPEALAGSTSWSPEFNMVQCI